MFFLNQKFYYTYHPGLPLYTLLHSSPTPMHLPPAHRWSFSISCYWNLISNLHSPEAPLCKKPQLQAITAIITGLDIWVHLLPLLKKQKSATHTLIKLMIPTSAHSRDFIYISFILLCLMLISRSLIKLVLLRQGLSCCNIFKYKHQNTLKVPPHIL